MTDKVKFTEYFDDFLIYAAKAKKVAKKAALGGPKVVRLSSALRQRGGDVSNFGAPGPPKMKRRLQDCKDWSPGANTPLGTANYILLLLL